MHALRGDPYLMQESSNTFGKKNEYLVNVSIPHLAIYHNVDVMDLIFPEFSFLLGI